MKKLFLLIISSWATSCLPVTDAERLSAQAQTKKTPSSQKLDEATQENQTRLVEIGVPALVLLAMPAVCTCAIVMIGQPLLYPVLLALALTTAEACPPLQDPYKVSKEYGLPGRGRC